MNICEYTGRDIHPSILRLILNMQTNTLENSNQVCISALNAIRDFFNDYRIGEGEDGRAPTAVFSRDHLLDLQAHWAKVISFIKDSKRLHEGVINALNEADRVVNAIKEDSTLKAVRQ